MRPITHTLAATLLAIPALANQPTDTNTTPPEPPAWSTNATIYEVNIRQFTEEGTFNAFRQHLPRLENLGVEILWLMPIHPIGEEQRKGELGSYYAVEDYRAVNPEFGTEDDLRALIKDAHNRNMKVILDFVPNHTAWDNPLTQTHPHFYSRNDQNQFHPPNADWSDVIQLDFGTQDEPNTELRDYMTETLLWWIDNFDIDGYRMDVAGIIPRDYWQDAIPTLIQRKPLFMLAEASGPHMHHDGFHTTYAWSLDDHAYRLANGQIDARELQNMLEAENNEYPPPMTRMHFTSNHDKNSWEGSAPERFGPAARALAALTFVLDGMPLIYNGQEAGLDKRLAFFTKDQIDWNDPDNWTDFYTALVNLKATNPALKHAGQGGTERFLTTNRPSTAIALARHLANDTPTPNDDHAVLYIANLSPNPTTLRIRPGLLTGDYQNIFTNTPKRLGPVTTFQLDPWSFQLLERQLN